MARRPGLGRGLEALIPGSESPQLSPGIRLIAVDRIEPNPRQPRTNFDSEALAELAESIRQHGVLQPLIVTEGEQQDHYTLIAGERRLMAARQAGLDLVPALVREAGEQQRLELALIENLQRSDLGPLEAAEAYRQLAEEFTLSHEEIAIRVGKKRPTVTNTLRLLNLPTSVRQALSEGKISEGHARALLALNSTQGQLAALQTILERSLSVRQTEELVRRLSGHKAQSKEKPAPSPEVTALEERLRASLGTRVRLNRRKNGGTLVIHFYSDEELNALVDQILGS
jgi:ParB family transcriptional regulator, chromosome partitioning protein